MAPTHCSVDRRFLSPGKHQLLLVVTDSREREELSGYLRGMADLFFARNDREAINILESRSVNIVVTNESGGDHGLCWFIKTSPRHAHIPVVALIPRDSVHARLQCLESGVDALLEKPVSRHILLAQVDNLVINRARIREHFTASGESRSAASPVVRKDEALWKRLNQVIEQHLSDTSLDTDLLARLLYMSRPTLYRKIAEMSRMSPSELITLVRLNSSTVLLTTTDHPIGDIAAMVGFTTRNGFGKAFLKQFDMTPSAYRTKYSPQHPQPVVRWGQLSGA
jgi:AraC-like DNA-binding protein